MTASAESRISLSQGRGIKGEGERGVIFTARGNFPALFPLTPALSLGEREKHFAALAANSPPLEFHGNKNETFFRWSLRLVFDTVALRRAFEHALADLNFQPSPHTSNTFP